jgi:Tfp pilus assembly protein PilO
VRPLLPREKTILWSAGFILVLVMFYVFAYSPRMAEIDALKAMLGAHQAELIRLQSDIARRENLEREVRELRDNLQLIEARLPTDPEIPNLLMQLERVASLVGVNLTQIKPGPIVPAGSARIAAPAAPGNTPPPHPGGTPDSSAPRAAPGPGRLTFQQFSLELDADGSYGTIESFVRGVEHFPRFIAITDLRLAPLPAKVGANPSKPRLSLNLAATAFVVPLGDDGR